MSKWHDPDLMLTGAFNLNATPPAEPQHEHDADCWRHNKACAHACIENLAVLLRRSLSHLPPKLREQTRDFLKRCGLEGSFLRAALAPTPDPEGQR